MHERPTTGSVLQILNEDLDNGRVIYRSHAKTDRSSVWRNRNNYYWKSAAFVTRKLRELAEYGPAALEAGPCSRGCNDVRSVSACLKAGQSQTLSLVGRLSGRARARGVSDCAKSISGASRFALNEAWPVHDPLSVQGAMAGGRMVVGRSFPVEAGDDYHVFLEVYDHATQRGHIGVSRLTRDGAFEASREGPGTALPPLVPPFVFRWRGTWFMMPESSKASRIEVFQLVSFLGSGRPRRYCSTRFRRLTRRWWPWKDGGGSSPMCRRIRRSAAMTSSSRSTARLRLARGRPTVEIP